jgi:nitroreductase
MDTFTCVATKLDVREFAKTPVPDDLVMKVLEAGRYTGSGMNKQHWHFVLVRSAESLSKLASCSPYGSWISEADFAVLVLTSPKWPFHLFDAGRAVQDMQIVAWSYGVASGLTTGFEEESVRIEFNIPREFSISAAIGFGYPSRKILGKKNRKPLREVASLDRFGNPLKAVRTTA